MVDSRERMLYLLFGASSAVYGEEFESAPATRAVQISNL
jgi:hypothetical protein